MGNEGSLKWASSFFTELGSWQDKSQNEFSKIVNTHNTIIIEGINGLIAEVHDLQNQLRTTAKEKNTFIETVVNLNGEIRKLKSEVINLKSSLHAKANCTQNEEEIYVEDLIVQEQGEGETNVKDNITESLCNLEPEEDSIKSEDCVNFNEQGNHLDVSSHEDGYDSQQEKGNGVDPTDQSEIDQLKKRKDKAKIELSKREEGYYMECQGQSNHSQGSHVNLSQDQLQNMKENHNQNKTNNKDFKCELCNFVTNSRKNLNQHINRIHNQRTHQRSIRRHICKECGKSYVMSKSLDEHIDAEHLGNKKFECDQCPYKTARVQSLNIHIKGIHEKIKRFSCTECSYATSQKGTLMYHIRSKHTEEKKFKCDKCPFSSASKQSLNNHIESIHNMGEKKFKCDICPYKSHLKHYLKHHVKYVHMKSTKGNKD